MTTSRGGSQPAGDERPVGADEMFFSTTDRLGVIRAGNSVFACISGYSLSELIGAPHNIIRHPDMPAGAFKLIWERLLAGQPAGSTGTATCRRRWPIPPG